MSIYKWFKDVILAALVPGENRRCHYCGCPDEEFVHHSRDTICPVCGRDPYGIDPGALDDLFHDEHEFVVTNDDFGGTVDCGECGWPMGPADVFCEACDEDLEW